MRKFCGESRYWPLEPGAVCSRPIYGVTAPTVAKIFDLCRRFVARLTLIPRLFSLLDLVREIFVDLHANYLFLCLRVRWERIGFDAMGDGYILAFLLILHTSSLSFDFKVSQESLLLLCLTCFIQSLQAWQVNKSFKWNQPTRKEK